MTIRALKKFRRLHKGIKHIEYSISAVRLNNNELYTYYKNIRIYNKRYKSFNMPMSITITVGTNYQKVYRFYSHSLKNSQLIGTTEIRSNGIHNCYRHKRKIQKKTSGRYKPRKLCDERMFKPTHQELKEIEILNRFRK